MSDITQQNWEVSKESHRYVIQAQEEFGKSALAVTAGKFYDSGKVAALISAAPDLLAACELLIAQYDSSGDFTMGGNLTNKPFMMAIEAIKKAKRNI